MSSWRLTSQPGFSVGKTHWDPTGIMITKLNFCYRIPFPIDQFFRDTLIMVWQNVCSARGFLEYQTILKFGITLLLSFEVKQ